MKDKPEYRFTNATGHYFYCERCGERVEPGETHECYGDPKERKDAKGGAA